MRPSTNSTSGQVLSYLKGSNQIIHLPIILTPNEKGVMLSGKQAQFNNSSELVRHYAQYDIPDPLPVALRLDTDVYSEAGGV